MRDLRQAAERLLDAIEIAFMYNIDLTHIACNGRDCIHCGMTKVLKMRMEELESLLNRDSVE